MTDTFNTKSQNLFKRFQNWFYTVHLKDACKWFIKWNVIYFLINPILSLVLLVVYFPLFLIVEDLDDDIMVWMVVIPIGLIYMFLAYIFNCIIVDRIVVVEERKKKMIYLLNISTIAVLLCSIIIVLNLDINIDEIDDDFAFSFTYISNFQKSIYTISSFLFLMFNAFLVKYGHEAYKLALWLMISTILSSIFYVWGQSDLFGILFLGLGIASFIRLYQTVHRCNM